MKFRIAIASLLLICLGCQSEGEQNELGEIAFDQVKWKTKDGKDYLYRDSMLNAVVYNDTIRTLNEAQLIDLLGQPDYSEDGHFYYRILEDRMGGWVLSSKTMVVKFSGDGSIEWIKIHG